MIAIKPILIVQLCDVERGELLDLELEKRSVLFRRLFLYKGETLPEISEVRAAVILGSPISVNDFQQHDWARELYAWTSKAIRLDLPILGICYGSQLLAKILGAVVSKHTELELGVYDARLTEAGATDNLFTGFPPTFCVAHWHGDTWKLPFGATLLCEGDGCRNQAFRRGKQLGLQFHLECGPRELQGWPLEYPEDLATTTKSQSDLAAQFSSGVQELSRLFSKLMENWLREV